MNATQRDAVRAAFRQAYAARYKRLPPSLIEGFLSSILTGEVQLMTDEPAFSPLLEMLPLLREAREKVVTAGGAAQLHLVTTEGDPHA
jgi:hypothetical protein